MQKPCNVFQLKRFLLSHLNSNLRFVFFLMVGFLVSSVQAQTLPCPDFGDIRVSIEQDPLRNFHNPGIQVLDENLYLYGYNRPGTFSNAKRLDNVRYEIKKIDRNGLVSTLVSNLAVSPKTNNDCETSIGTKILSNGNILVYWHAPGSNCGIQDAYFRILSPIGAELVGFQKINTNSVASRLVRNVEVEQLSDGSVAFIYSTSNNNYAMRRITESGTFIDAQEISITSLLGISDEPQFDHKIAANKDGRFIIFMDYSGTNSKYLIFENTGSTPVFVGDINSPVFGLFISPNAKALPNGNFLLSYKVQSNINQGTRAPAFRIVKPDGSLVGAEVRLSEFGAFGNFYDPVIIESGLEPGFLFSYNDNLKKYDFDGNFLYDLNPECIELNDTSLGISGLFTDIDGRLGAFVNDWPSPTEQNSDFILIRRNFGPPMTINFTQILSNASAKITANVGDPRGLELSERGIIYVDSLVTMRPVLETSGVVKLVNGSVQTGNFEATLNELSPNKSYAVRAYSKTSDGQVFYSKAVGVSTNTAPAFDHSLSDGVLKIDIPENSTTVLDVLVSDTDPGQTLTFNLQGTDAALFDFNQATRRITFKAVPNFEDPQDQNKDSVYEFSIIATDNAALPKSSALIIDVMVTNVAEIPAIQNLPVTDIGANGAKLNARIIHNGGGGDITASGFVLSATSANSNPQLGGTGVSDLEVGIALGDFFSLVTGLQPNTSYSYRGYATNSVGTTYTEVATFSIVPPVFGYSPALLQDINKEISAIQPENLGSEVPGDQAYATVSTFSTNVSGPRGMVMDAFGNLYVAERGGKRISKFTPDGTKTVIRQFGSFEPVDITIDGKTGDLYATIAAHRILWVPNTNKANYPTQQPTHVWTNDATNVFAGQSSSGTTDNVAGTSARFNAPSGIAMSPDNTYLLVAEYGSHRIRRVDLATKLVTTFAGSTSSGTSDGELISTARFNNPEGVHFAKDGTIYVTEWNSSNHRIRKISGDQVSTFVGSTIGFTDGLGTDAKFERPRGITSDPTGNLYVVEGNNNVVRKITPSGEVGVLAGSLAGGYNSSTIGTTDAVAFAARFNAPQGAYFAPDGSLYVADNAGNRIRRISLSGWELLTPLPAGLSFDDKTAGITGTPTTFTYSPYYFSAFDSNDLEKVTNGATPVLTGAAQVRSGFLQLTPFSNTQTGGMHIPGKGIKEGILRVDFRIITTKTSSAGNGLSYSFAQEINSNSTGIPEVGIGSGLSLAFNTTLGGIRLYYGASKANSSTVGTGGLLAFNANNTWRGKSAQVSLEVSYEGKVKVWIDGTLVFNDVQLPSAYLQEDFTTWNHVFRARTGTSNDLHAIDNLSIAQGNGTGNFRVRASNSLGTHTSSLEMSVVTLPVVNTLDVSEIIFNSAKVSFRTLFNGGSEMQKQGVIWGTSPNVTLDNALGKSEEILSQEEILVQLTGLLQMTKYYVRAYAENAFGVGYGSELSFETPMEPPLFAYESDRIILRKDKSASLPVTSSGGAVPNVFPYEVSTFAGSRFSGSNNGQGVNARFYRPTGIALDALGNIYVADTQNHRIRKITPDGMVSTLAGFFEGFADGQGNLAQFAQPQGIAVDKDGNIYVADTRNHRIRKITPDGVVSTFAGSSFGSLDSQGTAAQFSNPTGITIDSDGNLYVTDASSHRIRKITPDGMVSTLAGSSQGSLDGQGTSAQFDKPSGIALDAVGNIYVTELGSHRIRRITPDGMVSTLAGSSIGFGNGQGTSAKFWEPNGIVVDTAGNIYVADERNNRIRKITPDGMVSTLAGSSPGSLDGIGTAAQFSGPAGIALDAVGNLYVADKINNSIRKVSFSGWSISPELPAGLVLNTDGSITGTPTTVSLTQTYTLTGANDGGTYSFSFELGVLEVSLSNLTVSNGSLNLPFKPEQTSYSVVSADAKVSSISFTATELFAGSTIQWKLGSGSFSSIASSTASPDILLDEGRNLITIEVSEGIDTKVYTLIVTNPVTPPAISYVQSLTLPLGESISPQHPQNTGGPVPKEFINWVSTIAGSSSGSLDGQGTAARFNLPSGITVDAAGNLYVTEFRGHRIRKITPEGMVSTIAGSSQGFNEGQGTAARFDQPRGITVDAAGNLYVTESGRNRIRKITPDGMVSTLAGNFQRNGDLDGQGTDASFRGPEQITIDAAGNLYVADESNMRIRKITPSGLVSTFAGSSSGTLDGQGTAAQFSNPTGITIDGAGNLYVTDLTSHRIRKITPDGMVSTFAGSSQGLLDGQGTAAEFVRPNSITVDAAGNFYVVEGSNRIRKITPDGMVSTLAGSSYGRLDGLGTAAQFGSPRGITIDADGNLYVADFENHIIRKINQVGWSVSPSLPAGLVLNEDGSISGTPTVLSPATDFVVTGKNAAGESSFTIRIEVTSGPTEGLRNLELSAGGLSPAFYGTTYSYGVELPAEIGSLSFTPTAVNQNASLTLNGGDVVNATATNAYPLNFGPNTFTFVVKEADNTEKTYTVVVTRALGKTQNEILWEGTNGKQWSLGGNWKGNTRPASGADVKFSPTAVNDLEVDEDLIAGTIYFNGSDKKVVLVNNDLSVSGFATRTAPNYVELTGSGRLKASVSSNLKFLFPVGMDTYSPVSITNKTGAAAVFSVGLSGEVLDGGTTGNAIPNARIKRTWDIGNASSSVSGSGIDLEFNWTAADDSGVKNPALYHYENGAWVKLDAAKTTVDLSSRILIFSGYTGSLSPFAIYDELPSETQLTISLPTLTKTKSYDGTNTAQVNEGTLSGVADGDEVTVTATAEYDNANAGTGKTIRVVYTLDGADASKYLKPVDEEYADGEITKIQLTAAAPTLTTSKGYDGTVKATVEAGTLQGVLTDETVNLMASAAYETATAGNDKKITVSYTIDGSDAVNYLAPVNEEVNTGQITPAPLTVTIKADAKFVGQTDAAGFNGANISGFIDGEDESALSGTLAISRSNSSVNSAGDYPGVLNGSGYTSDNYTITYVDGDYSILPADALLVKLETAKPTYGTDPAYTLVSAGYFSAAQEQLVDLTDQTTINGNEVLVFDGIDQIRFDLYISNPLISTSGNLKAGSYTVTFANEELSSNVNSLKVIGQVEVVPLALQARVTTGEFKEYDGTPAMLDVNVDASGLIAGDEVTVSSGAGLFGGSNAGSQGYAISALSLTGEDAANYTLDSELTGQGQITPKALMVTGTTVTKLKAYDGTAEAQVSRGTVSGIINTDKVSLSVSASYADKFAGENKPITVSYTLEGNAAANYTAPASESVLDGEITQKALNITDPSVVLRKEYDGTRSASVDAGSLLGLISGDDVTVTASGQYDDASIGTGKTITVTYSLSGSDILNYQATLQEFVTNEGEIYGSGPVQLLITEPDLTLIKSYDKNATATAVAGNLIGLAPNADVTVTATASYENAAIGTGKKITVVYTLTGPDADEYVAPPDYVVNTGEIKAIQLTITDPTVTLSKIFDGTTSANVESIGTVSGILDDDNVIVEASASYEDSAIGIGKKITVTYTLTGTVSANYLAPEDFVLTTGEIKDAIVDQDGDGIPDDEDLDIDGDGIDNTIEQEVPSANGTGKGDGNGDGIPDYLQAYVVSFVTAETGIRGAQQFVTLAAPAGNYVFSEVVSEKKPAGLARSVSSRLPFGVIKFTLSGLTAGEEITLTVFVPRSTALTGYFKQAIGQSTYTNLAEGGISITGNNKSLSFKISDNGAYDLDLEEGLLKDPGLITAHPMISSNGGEEIAELAVKENQVAVTTVEASDLESSTFTFGIEDGADQALFEIDATTGVVTFKDSPDFENPTDADQDNVYELIVNAFASNGTIDRQWLYVTVEDDNDSPSFQIPDGGVALLRPLVEFEDKDAASSTDENPGDDMFGFGLNGEPTLDIYSLFEDQDQGAGNTMTGIAISENSADPDTEGVWEYSTDLDVSVWYPIGAVSLENALLLDLEAYLRFVPVPHFFGSPKGLKVHPVDGSGVTVAPEINSAGGTAWTLEADKKYYTDLNDDASNSSVGPLSIEVNIEVEGTEDLPEAEEVSVSGIAQVESELTGSYTYVDVDGDTESGTQVAWYRSATGDAGSWEEISGASSNNYTLTLDDLDQYIRFGVRPNDGKAFGEWSFSNKIGRIAPNGKVQLSITDPTSIFEKVYDGKTSLPVNPGELTGVLKGDEVTVEAFANFDSPEVGENKTVTVVYTLTGGDAYKYNPPMNFLASSGRVTKAPLKVIVQSAQKLFGNADPEFEVSYDKFVGNDSPADLGGILSFSRMPGEDLGKYSIHASGLTSSNYEINFVSGTLCIQRGPISNEEQQALNTLFGQLNGKKWTNTIGWNQVLSDNINSCTLDSPYGVTITFTNDVWTVTGIDFSSNNLEGELPDVFGAFPNLISLNLAGNCIEGPVPTSLASLSNLESLDLSRNRFNGFTLTSLSATNVNVSFNALGQGDDNTALMEAKQADYLSTQTIAPSPITIEADATAATISWEAIGYSTGQGYYEVRLRRTGTTSWSTRTTENKGQSSVSFNNLTGSTEYEVQIRTLSIDAEADCYTFSRWSERSTFSTLQPLPAKASLISPKDYAINTATALNLVVGTAANAESYEIQLSSDPNFSPGSTISYSSATGTQAIADLNPNQRYYWRARGVNGRGNGPWSNTGQFRTALSQSTAMLVGAITCATEGSQILQWNAIEGASHYRIEVATDAKFGNVIRRSTALQQTQLTIFDLAPNRTYYWRVQAYNDISGFIGNWSASGQLSIQPRIAITGELELCKGSSTIMSLNTEGSIQWYSNGTAIAGATASTYTATTAGSYYAIIGNASNTACASYQTESIVITEAVETTPTITASSTQICEGESTTLSTTAKGTAYQWYRNGQMIAGARSSSYNTSQAGTYTVEVSINNSCSSISAGTTIETIALPQGLSITNTGAADLCGTTEGSILTLNTSAEQLSGLSIQWLRNGAAIAGATQASYTATEAGDYSAQISIGTCRTTTASISLTGTVLPIPTISLTELGQTQLRLGIPVALRASAAPSGTRYVWYRDGEELVGLNSAMILATRSGDYQVALESSTGCSTLSVAFPLAWPEGKEPRDQQARTIDARDLSEMAQEISDGWIQAFPNPTQSTITISVSADRLNGSRVKVRVIDFLGRTVYSGSLEQTGDRYETTFNMSNLRKGLYHIHVEDGRVSYRRMVKKE